MEFYNEKEQLYLETDAMVVGLGASLLQVRDEMWFLRNVTSISAHIVGNIVCKQKPGKCKNPP